MFVAGWKLSHFHKPPGAVTVMYGSAGTSSAHSAERERDAFQSKLNNTLKSQLDKVISSQHSWPFKETVSSEEVRECRLCCFMFVAICIIYCYTVLCFISLGCVLQYPEYYDLIKDPITLQEINERLREGDYYRSREMMYEELLRMVGTHISSRCVLVL